MSRVFPSLCAQRVKAARAFLDWSQDDLAKASGVAVSTIRNFETGYMPRGRTTALIRQAIERAGLEFIEPDGFRRRNDEIMVLDDADNDTRLLEDIDSELRRNGGDFIAVMGSDSLFESFYTGWGRDKKGLFGIVSKLAPVLCLCSLEATSTYVDKKVIVKRVQKEVVGPMSFLVYGNKHVLVLNEGADKLRYIVFSSAEIAQAYRVHFLRLWEATMTAGS